MPSPFSMASEAIITLDVSCEGKLYTRTSESSVIRTASTLEGAARALLKAVPADRVRGVFIIPHTDDNIDDSFNRKEMTRVLKAVGYTDVRVFDTLPFQYSMALACSKIRCKEGELVCIESIGNGGGDQRLLKVFRKTADGYEFVRTLSNPAQLSKTFPQLTKVIVDSPIKLPNGPKRRISAGYAPLHVTFAPTSLKMRSYLWSLVDGDKFGGNLVTMDVRSEFKIAFGNELIFAPVRMDVIPWANSVKLNIGHVSRVNVTMDNKYDTTPVKTFKFSTSAHRFVKLSLFLDENCHPSAELNEIDEEDMYDESDSDEEFVEDSDDEGEDPTGCNQM